MVQLKTLMLLCGALEMLRMISKTLKGDNYRRMILSRGHSVRYSSSLQFRNKNIMGIRGNNPDTFKGQLA